MKKIILCATLTLFCTAAFANEKTALDERMRLLREIIDIVKRDHVTKKEDEELFKAAVNGMLTSLDPHSAWLDPQTYKDMQISTRGKFGGLGIEVTMDKGFVRVVSPIDGTPAAKAGIQAGDLITHLDKTPILGKTLIQAVHIMRGVPGTKIKLTVRRKGVEEPFFIHITRAIIKIKAVSTKAFGKIAYLRLTTFNELAQRNLLKGIRKAQATYQPEGYILDLRNNPGGLLNQAVSVSDLFLHEGEIVSIRGRKNVGWAQMSDRFVASAGDVLDGKPIIVLINGGSASASEIVAGALQDHKRAITLGTLSFGKGSVQTVRPLGAQKGALKLTTARYYTPSGRSIQARGVMPDILVEQKGDKKPFRAGETKLQKHLQNEKTKDRSSGSSVFVPKEQTKDTQLNRALSLLRGVIRATKESGQAKNAAPHNG